MIGKHFRAVFLAVKSQFYIDKIGYLFPVRAMLCCARTTFQSNNYLQIKNDEQRFKPLFLLLPLNHLKNFEEHQHQHQMLLWKYEQTNMHTQTCPSKAKSAIEVILRKRNAKIRSKPETTIWNLLCFGIRNLQGQNLDSSTQNPQSTAQNQESNTVQDYFTWGEICLLNFQFLL